MVQKIIEDSKCSENILGEIIPRLMEGDPKTRMTSQQLIEKIQASVTVVCTCVDGLQKLRVTTAQGVADGWELHNGVIQASIQKHSGFVVQHDEDGRFVVSFNRPKDAVAWCQDVQLQLLTQPRSTDLLGSGVPESSTVEAGGKVIFNGLRVAMAIYSGFPSSARGNATE